MFGEAGEAVLAWTFSQARTQVATRSRSGAYSATRVVAGELADAPVAYGETRAVFLRRTDAGDGRVRLGVSYGRTDGDIDPLRTLDTFRSGGDAAIDASDEGQIAVAWVERTGGQDRLWLVSRSPGGKFSDPRIIRGSGQMADVAVAHGDGGDLLVAYRRGDRLEARVRRDGGSLGGVQDLGPAGADTQIAASTAPTGRMVVAWRERSTRDDGAEALPTVRAAIRPAGPRSFRDSEVVGDRGVSDLAQAGRVAVETAPDGTATVVFSELDGDVLTMRAASTDARASFTQPQTISPRGSVDDLAVTESGAIVTFTEPPSSAGNGIVALTRPTAGVFGTPELVSPRRDASDSAVAIDPTSGLPTIAWIAGAGDKQIVRAATRTG